MNVHPIKIEFHVTEKIRRFVYVYLIEAEYCYLIDAGVAGCQDVICSRLQQIGRKLSDVKGIYLTHAHPDHIGSAAWFREKTGCKVYASSGEKRWIENIDIQYAARPIPGFYRLAGSSVPVDLVVCDGMTTEPEKGLVLQVIGTPGHSADEVSYRISDWIFTGDSIPVRGELPIYVDWKKTQESMERLETIRGVQWFCPAWDDVFSMTEREDKIREGKQIVHRIEASVKKHEKMAETGSLQELVSSVCQELHMPGLIGNPLFAETVKCHLEG